MKKNAGDVGDFPIKQPTPYYLNNTCRDTFERSKSKLRQYGIGDVLDHQSGGIKRSAQKDLLRFSTEDQHRIISLVRDVSTFKHWESYREVYFFHPRMSESLLDMKSDKITIPGPTLKNLRHLNPFIATPAVPYFTHADGHPGRILGFYLCGAITEDYPFSRGAKTKVDFSQPSPYRRSVLFDTNFEDINALHVMVMSEVLSHDGHEIIDYDICNMTIPLIGEFTLAESIDMTEKSFSWSADFAGEMSQEKKSGYLKIMSRMVISHLLYVTSRSFECDGGQSGEENQRPFTKKSKRSKAPLPPARLYPVGYRMGAAIEGSYRKAQEIRERGGDPVSTGRTLPAHIRSPHSHLYRVGKGRSEIDIKFLGPIPVNPHLDDGEITTLHPVR